MQAEIVKVNGGERFIERKISRKSIAKNLDGCRFGMLQIISEAGWTIDPCGHYTRWVNVKCDCGTEKAMRASKITQTNGYRSCGCAKIPQVIRARREKPVTVFRHGLSGRRDRHRLYSIWTSMKQRCCNRNYSSFHRYGGRGISLCAHWIDNPAAFVVYVETVLGPRPTAGHTIDRIDNNGNYEPGNLRWATRAEQSANRSPASQWKYKRGRR